jgi:hypothetical protein
MDLRDKFKGEGEKPPDILVISSADEIVNRNFKIDAEFNQNVETRLISAYFPARYCGFCHFEMLCKVTLFDVFFLTK